MVYIDKFRIKGNVYYRLVHAVRKGKKVAHRFKYLGKSIPPKKRLEHLKKEFLKEVRGERYAYFSQNDVHLIELKKKSYVREMKGLSKPEKERNLKEFIIRFTYDSSKLSGAEITLRQTYLILREGIMPKNIKGLRTVKELENHEKGIIAISTYRGKLDIKFLKKLHRILFLGVDDSISGKLRDELKRNVKVAGTSYVPPPWKEIAKELKNFFIWYKKESRKLHPLELAALVHLKIISIQPFVDGNSRISRLLMNWILWKKNYPLVEIPIEDLENYYNALDRYQVEKKEKPFIQYIKDKYMKS